MIGDHALTAAGNNDQVAKADALGRTDDTAAAAGLAQLLAARYSCRAYTGEPVSRSTIRCIVEIAQLTASWCNAQAWQLMVTTGRGTDRFRDALYAHARAAAPGADAFDLPTPVRFDGVYRDRRRECGWALYESVGIGRGDRVASARQALENFRLFGAPHVAIVTTPRDLGVYGAIDCGGFIATLSDFLDTPRGRPSVGH